MKQLLPASATPGQAFFRRNVKNGTTVDGNACRSYSNQSLARRQGYRLKVVLLTAEKQMQGKTSKSCFSSGHFREKWCTLVEQPRSRASH